MKGKKYLSVILSSILSFTMTCPINAQKTNNESKNIKVQSMEFYKKASKLVKENWNDDFFKSIKLKVGENYAKIDDNKKIKLSHDVYIKDKKIILPTNEIAEISGQSINKDDKKLQSIDVLKNTLGYTYKYNKNTKEIEISSPYQTMRLITKLKNTNSNLKKYKASEIVKGEDNIVVLQFDSVEKTKEACNQIKKDKIATYVEPDKYISLDEDKAKSSTKLGGTYKSWGTKYIEADKYASYLQGKNIKGSVTVGVVDTGIDKNHSFFKKRIAPRGYDFVNCDNNADDDHGHGSHVSGIIVDCTPKLSIKILPVKVLNYSNRGTVLNAGFGIEYAMANGANLINFSIGLDSHSDYMHEIIEKCLASDIPFVMSAGNKNNNTYYECPSDMNEPIVVSSIDSYGSKSYFSNYGKTIDVSAPGENIYSVALGGGYTYMSGTSMAAPHVTAACAMYKLNNPKLTCSQISKVLRKNTKDLGAKGYDIYYGQGVPKLSLAIPKVTVGKVTNLKAKSNSYNSIKLTWKKASNASGYEILRSTSKNGKYSKIKTISSGKTVSYTNSSLKTGKTYYYKLRAYKTVGSKKVYGKYTSIVSAKSKLSTPTLSVKAAYKKAYLKWKKVSGASGYKIYRSTKKNGKYTTIKTIKNGKSTSFTNTSVSRRKTYYYKIRAYRYVDGKIVYSSYSSIKSAKIK